MRLTGRKIEAFLAGPDLRTVLVFGPDAGLVGERGLRLVRGIVEDLDDPFRVAELTPEAIRDDPARLVDEVQALSLTGGRRVVRVRQAADGVTRAVEGLLRLERPEALVVLEAGDLRPSSSLRRLVERARNAAAIPCYREAGAELRTTVSDILAGHGVSVDGAALDWLVTHLGADRAVTRNEISKLALYAGDKRGSLGLDDVVRVIGDSSALSLDDAVHGAALGDFRRLERALDRLSGTGHNPIAVLRGMAAHWLRLFRLRAAVEGGQSIDQAMREAKPPVPFPIQSAVRRELALWRSASVMRALARLLEAETRCKTTGLPAPIIMRSAAFALCRAAHAAGRS